MAERLKERFFTTTSITEFADAIAGVSPVFDREGFLECIYDADWEERELKDKMHHTTRCLHAALPLPYPEALDVLRKAAPSVKGFEALVFPDFVEMYGLDYPDLSLEALGYFTRFGSAEFAVRPFLIQDLGRGISYLLKWADDPDENVRRLASEGCRPRLPWAIALNDLKADPGPILPVLEKLKDDPSEMVRRSVANNLNDISKDHPDLVLDVCRRWYGVSERTDALLKHACRGLLKAGNPAALHIFGFDAPEQVSVEGLSVESKQFPIGGTLSFGFTLQVQGDTACSVRLEYVIGYRKANGSRSKKVFKHSERTYEPGTYTIKKRHTMQDMSTRRHYPGEHHLWIHVNGHPKADTSFVLEPVEMV